MAMPSLTVKNIDTSIINALKERALKHHRTIEAEHRAVLMQALMQPKRKTFAEALLSIPNVGTDNDFERLNDDVQANVFD